MSLTVACLILLVCGDITPVTSSHRETDHTGRLGVKFLDGVINSMSQKLDSLKSLVFSLLSSGSGDFIQSCQLPLFTLGCPSGTVCASRRPGRNVCEPQRDDGTFCETGDQCKSAECRNYNYSGMPQLYYCASDQCPQKGQQSTCGLGLTCTATLRGNRCRPQSTSLLASLPQDDTELVRLQREVDLQRKRELY